MIKVPPPPLDRIAAEMGHDCALPEEPALEVVACDACGKPIEGEPAGHGLLLWTRGEEQRIEQPPLCASCARAITAAGTGMWDEDPDGEG